MQASIRNIYSAIICSANNLHLIRSAVPDIDVDSVIRLINIYIITVRMRNLVPEKVKMSGDIPSPRFGHTFTMVTKTKAVLFGGAVSVAGKFIITNETFLFDFTTNAWKKLNFANNFVPSERAAHAATALCDMQMFVYGGAASTQGLLKDELYLLDLRKSPIWKIIDVAPKNNTPGQRYGHTMVFNKPYLIIFGGNSASKVENDVWILNFQKGPFSWAKYEFENGRTPCPRVYHSAALCDTGRVAGMMVVFGGRRQTKRENNNSQRQISVSALNDIWGLVKHRNGTWDWATPPRTDGYMPIGRYQHLVCFLGSKLVIMGGRASNPEESVSCIEMYDTETAEWTRINSVSRYRHTLAMLNNTKIFVHGGFQPEYASQPLDTMICLDLSAYRSKGPPSSNSTQKTPSMTEQYNAIKLSQTEQIKERQAVALRQIGESQQNVTNHSRIRSAVDKSKANERDLTPSRIINVNKNTRLSNQAIVATGDKNSHLVQRVPVSSLMEESKRLNNQPEDGLGRDEVLNEFLENVLAILMPTNGGFKANGTNIFPLKKDKIYRLCHETCKILVEESSLIGVRSPIKIFGSLYGRHSELLRFFDSFGYPDDRQMETFEYIFLGNYVDKGFNSLETICLLMALKLKHPDHIHLLRGRHEDAEINKICGLGEECAIRLGENINESQSAFVALNGVFDLLPLAAAIEDKFLCVNNGIGVVGNILNIKNVVRPVKVKESQIVTDLLWSELDGNQKLGYHSRKCTEEEMQQFLESNGLDMLINTKDGLANGVEEDKCILSIFSISNYPQQNNKAGILRINKDLEVIPHILKPSPTNKGLWFNEQQNKANLSFSPAETEFRKSMFEITN